MDIKVKVLTIDEAVSCVPYLRDADIREVESSHGRGCDMESIVLDSVLASTKVYGGWTDGLDYPFCIFGIAPCPDEDSLGFIWMLGTPVIEQVKIEFLRKCAAELADLEKGFDKIVCASDVRNTTHHKWLQWLGFTKDNRVRVPYGILVCFSKEIE